jgi:CRISPR-associated protein Csb2
VPTTLVVSFELGRYHATPWGRHVNEGQVELPPSPWRLLRALYAVWKTRVPELGEDVMHGLLGRLAEPPTYFVPPYTLGHTRHWYPDSTRRSGVSGSTDRTLDAFASLDRRAELGIRWPFELDTGQEKALARIAESLPYLGRADSVCTARVDPLWVAPSGHTPCGPLDIGESVPGDVPAVALLAPTLPLDLDALTLRPVDVRAGKLLFPRSTRFVGYLAPEPARPAPPVRRPSTARVEAVRFEVVSRVRPPAGEGLHLTDRLRNAAVAKLCSLRDQELGDSLLAGRSADQERLMGHRHAHYLALQDSEWRVGELAVWVPDRLGEHELEALGRVRCLTGPPGAPGPGAVQVRLSGYGTAAAVLPELTRVAKVWRSVTPFAPPRYQKGDWGSFLRAEVRRELAHREMSAAEVEVLDGDWASYVRYRTSKRFAANGADRRSAPRAAFLRLTFDEGQEGPLALGYLCHFGLGLFEPEPDP